MHHDSYEGPTALRSDPAEQHKSFQTRFSASRLLMCQHRHHVCESQLSASERWMLLTAADISAWQVFATMLMPTQQHDAIATTAAKHGLILFNNKQQLDRTRPAMASTYTITHDIPTGNSTFCQYYASCNTNWRLASCILAATPCAVILCSMRALMHRTWQVVTRCCPARAPESNSEHPRGTQILIIFNGG